MMREQSTSSIRTMQGQRRAIARAMHAFRALSLTLFAFLLLACDDVSCPLNNTVTSVYNFYASARGDDGVFKAGASVSVADTITVSAIDLDSVISNKSYSISTLSLPVSYYHAADSLLWTFADSRGRHAYDTIIIHKTNIHHFDDPSCPAHMWHHIDSIHFSRNVIDTIIVATADINYDGLENFKIYFRTSTDEDDDTTDDDATDDTATQS